MTQCYPDLSIIHTKYEKFHTHQKIYLQKIGKLLNLGLTRSQKQVIYLNILKMITLTNIMQKHQMKL